jgi:hypothetical protein
MDFGENVNYTKEQILERNGLRKTDEIIHLKNIVESMFLEEKKTK